MSLSLLLAFSLLLSTSHGSTDAERKSYIVYMGDLPQTASPAADLHHSLLTAVVEDESVARKALLRSYTKSFNGFAAKLSPDQAERISEMEGVLSVFPSGKRHHHTTNSWDFIGFPQTVRRMPAMERDIIIGLLDTGIWQGSPSFDDKGLGPPPARWKGRCEIGPKFSACNNKLIGARYYRTDEKTTIKNDYQSPADVEGHGTHTSSTAAGVAVDNASLYGLANGTARGAVPAARVAMYKVCWEDEGCADEDVLAAFDDAIYEGVDVFSISLGGSGANPYFHDPIAIGAFHAMKKGVFTACSAGNDGPNMWSVTNSAPWIVTVGATSIGRDFRTRVALGNGKKLSGVSINTFSPRKQAYPLITGVQAANSSQPEYAATCEFGYLDEKKVKGKIVYCVDGSGGQADIVDILGGAGTLIKNLYLLSIPLTYPISTAVLNHRVAKDVEEYVNSTTDARAIIFKSRVVHNPKAPFMASFSSRGPNILSARILKPDISAPGLSILAAFSPLSTVSGSQEDKRIAQYNILSGTSMACPHVSGAAAYVKSFHPKWSPAAIRSALMTTATKIRQPLKHGLVGEFAYGTGQLNPVGALHPGLVYDADERSYIGFLCLEGYNGTKLAPLTGGEGVNCSRVRRAQGSDGLNYPSMQYMVKNRRLPFSTVFRRRVTNVGSPKAVYKASVASHRNRLNITVIPSTLTFTRLNQRKSFKVVVRGGELGDMVGISGSLVWSGSVHKVRSPIVVYRGDVWGIL